MVKKIYTTEQIDWLKTQYSKNLTLKEITNNFNEKFNKNVTEKAIGTICNKAGLSRSNHYSKEQVKWIEDNYQNYSTKKELLEVFNQRFNANMNRGTLYSIIKRKGILPKGVYTEEQINWLMENHKNYKSMPLLTHDYNERFKENRSVQAISSECWSLGLKMRVAPPPREINHHYTDEEKQWLKENYLKYSEKEISSLFNKKFNRHTKPNALSGYMVNCLGIRISDNKKRYSQLRKQLSEKPIGSEITKDGRVLVKIANKPYGKYSNWELKSRVINNAKENERVYIIDPSKPITKENTIVTEKKYQANLNILHYNDLVPELKPLAIKIAQLKYLHKHYEDKGEIKNGSK